MKRKLFYLLFISAVMFFTGCGDALYDVYNDFTGPVESVALAKTASVVIGTTEQLRASVYPSMTENKDVTWEIVSQSDTSGNTATGIASIDASGRFTASVLGSATVKATTVDGGFTAECVVTVVPTPIAIESITLDDVSLGTGQWRQLSCNITPTNATSTELTWFSSDPQTVTVDADGNVGALRNGSAIITATSAHWNKSGTCTVTVGDPTYTVTYNSNYTGGPASVDGGRYKLNDILTLLNNTTFTRQYYILTGWNTKFDGSGGSYAASTSSYSMGAQNVIFYAQWTPVSYSAVFNGNGNSGGAVPSVIAQQGGNQITLPNENTLTCTNFIFICWNTAANGTGIDYNAGQSYTMTGDITFYAKWKYDVSHSYVLRASGPGGGLIFYDKGYYSEGWQYMEAAPADITACFSVSEGYFNFTTGTAVGTGKENTDTIITYFTNTTIAAYKCRNYINSGKNDWFLPSKDECNLIYDNLIKINPVGGFRLISDSDSLSYYWSSTFIYSTSVSRNNCSVTNFWGNNTWPPYIWWNNLGLIPTRSARPVRRF